jgi:small-conductance mechanosensitive channel
MKKLIEFLNYNFRFSDDVQISIKAIIVVILTLVVTALLLKLIRKIVTRKIPDEDKVKFISLFSYSKWFIYVIIILMTFHNIGVNVTAIFAASAALLVGVGLALQTLFQDIISGVFILVDQSVHVGDIIELDGKVGRVEDIKLRTTRAVTIDNKVLIIPNHLYLTNSLYNWTENGVETRENVLVGVAYGSDVQLVKKLLMQAANSHPSVLVAPEPVVLFTNFGESSLDFKLVFTLKNSFEAGLPKSDIRFEIDRLFREHNIQIPFPQRDVHIYKSES